MIFLAKRTVDNFVTQTDGASAVTMCSASIVSVRSRPHHRMFIHKVSGTLFHFGAYHIAAQLSWDGDLQRRSKRLCCGPRGSGNNPPARQQRILQQSAGRQQRHIERCSSMLHSSKGEGNVPTQAGPAAKAAERNVLQSNSFLFEPRSFNESLKCYASL
jgi:hypothetical protein